MSDSILVADPISPPEHVPLDPEALELHMVGEEQEPSEPTDPFEQLPSGDGRQIIRAGKLTIKHAKGTSVFENCILATEPEMIFMTNSETGMSGMVPNPLRRFAGVITYVDGTSRVDFFNLDDVTSIGMRDAK